MKIGFVTGYFTPLENFAAAVRAKSMADYFLQQGHTVGIYTQALSNKVKEYHLHKSILNLPSNKSSMGVRLAIECMYSLEKGFQLLFSKKFSLVIISSPSFLTAIVCSTICRIRKQKYILDIRDLYPDVFFWTKVIKEHSFIGRRLRKAEKNMYDHALFVFTVTDELTQVIGKRTIKKVFCIRNGFDGSVFYPGDTKKKIFSVITHGNLGYAQNVDLLTKLIDYFKNRDDVHFYIIGEGKHENRIKELKQANCTYIPFLPVPELSALIRECHVGLSLRDDTVFGTTAFPVRVYEYIGSGVPVIVTPKGEAGLIVENYKVGFQFQGEENVEICNLMENFINNPKKLNIYIQNIKECRKLFERNNQNKLLMREIEQISL